MLKPLNSRRYKLFFMQMQQRIRPARAGYWAATSPM